MLMLRASQLEILAGDATVDVWVRQSPLRQERQHLIVPAGLSIAEILAECEPLGLRLGAPVHVTIDGHVIERRNYGRVRPKEGRTVAIVRVPAGGATRSILSLVVAVAALVAAPFLAGPLISAFGITAGSSAALAVTGLIGAGLTIAGTLALNALFPVARTAEAITDTTTTLYSIGGGQNSAQQYGAVPFVFGTHRISPPYASGAYTEIVGDDQYLRMLFCVGSAPIQVSDIKIGETAIDTFDDVTYEVIADHTATAPTLYTQPVYEETISAELTHASGWVQRTTADHVDEISVDVSWPSGVYRWQKSDGNRVSYTVTVDVQYAVASSGTWVDAGTISLNSSSSQAVRRSLSWTVANGKYDVRLSKTSTDYSGSDTVAETTYWGAVRGRRHVSAIKFPIPLTLIAVRIRGTNQLNGTVNTLNCIASPLIRAWSGTAWVAGQITRNPADHFREVLQGVSNARPVDDAAIDLVGLQAWHAYCATAGFTFDLVATDQKSVYDRLTQIAAAGRAAVSFRDGKWGVVWDISGSPIVQHFSPRNSSNFSSKRAYVDLPHGFRVSFINRTNGYLNDERVVYDDGYSAANATKFEGIGFDGVTDPDLIWRHGRYHIAQLRLQRETYSLQTDFEHLVCTRGDRVRVNHDVVEWGLGAARVKAVSTSPQGVTLDDVMTMQSGKTYAMRFRLADGSALVRSITGIDGAFAAFTFADSGTLPAIGDLVLFGEQTLESVVLRVKSIAAAADLTATIELVDDAPGILLADTGTIPAFATGIVGPVDKRPYAPTNLTYTEDVWSTSPATSVLHLAWLAPRVGAVQGYLVQIASQGSGSWSKAANSASASIDLTDIAYGTYDVRIAAVFADGQISAWLTSTVSAIIFDRVPADVTDFRISVSGETATLQWTAAGDDVVAFYQTRFSTGTTGATWETSSTLKTQVYGTQVQVPARVGTYLIKAVSYSGIESANAAVIISTIDTTVAFNAVYSVTEDPTFGGILADCTISSGQIRLATAGEYFEDVDFFDPGDFFLGGVGARFYSDGYYSFTNVLDLGATYTARVTASIEAFGESASDDFYTPDDFFDPADFYGSLGAGLWDVRIEVATTLDDPAGLPAWSDWTELIVGSATARAWRWRAHLISRQADITPVVTGLSIAVDMPDRVIAGNDIAVPAGGATVSFLPPFRSLQGLSIAAQGLATGDYYTITAKDEAGFHIAFANSSGSPVARTLDWVAKGYGVQQ